MAADYPIVAEADDPLTKALKIRMAASQADRQQEYSHWLTGQGKAKLVPDTAKQAMEARLDFEGTTADRIGAL